MVVEDESAIRESMTELLEDEGYDVSFAENGAQALKRLRAAVELPEVIVLDLRMPVMDGWEFRAIQKDDPTIGSIPVVALSADRSAPAVAISAEAYLQKPIDVTTLLRTIERILFESERRQLSARLEDAERLASLGRVAAGVGHEINNPLTFAILNLNLSLTKLRQMTGGTGMESTPAAAGPPVGEGALAAPAGQTNDSANLAGVTEMLEDCQVGLERIRQTVSNLQRLSRQGKDDRAPLDVRQVIEESLSMAWNQIRHRARLTRDLGGVPAVLGNAAALGQVFLNMLINAAQSIPEGDAARNEIMVVTRVEDDHVVVEIRDTGQGIAADTLAHVFEPFFTTKPVGLGTGLGLSISRQAVTDHGGRIEVESQVGKGSVFRVLLPAHRNAIAESRGVIYERLETAPTPRRGSVLVIDDEPAIGNAVRAALSSEHDVTVVLCAGDAFAELQAGRRFDLVLCDVVMPVISGPEAYATIAARWPDVLPHLVFMTGGAFTPATAAFVGRALTPLLPKPFRLEDLLRLVREQVEGMRGEPPHELPP